MELEVEAVERPVGSFRADILARAVDEAGHRVIIENQFGLTDHGHLGQILTYLAGVEETKTISGSPKHPARPSGCSGLAQREHARRFFFFCH